MDLQIALLAAAVREGTAGIDALHSHGINGDILTGDAKRVYEFIKEYNDRFKDIPSISIIYNKLGITLPELTEHLAFYIDEFKNVNLYNFIQDSLYKCANEQSLSKDPYKTMQLLEDIVIKGRSLLTTSGQIEDISEIGDDAFSLYERFEREEKGITTPWEGINDISAGFWGQDVIVWAANGGKGKCVEANTIVTNPKNGKQLTIKDAVTDPEFTSIYSWSEFGGLQVKDISVKVNTGKKECFKFTLESGREISVTPEHPFITKDGWKKAEELKVTDLIGTPEYLPFPEWPRFETFDRYSGYDIFHDPEDEMNHISDLFTLSWKPLISEFFDIFFAHMCYEFGSIKIEVPSKKIAKQVQSLLLRLRIQSKIKINEKIKLDKIYISDDIETYSNCFEVELSLIGSANLFKLLLDNLSQAAYKKLINALNRKRIDLGAILALIDFENSLILDRKFPNVVWDEIKNKESDGIREVFDFTVPNTHCFIANDIIVHNTWLMLLQALHTTEVLKQKVLFVSPEMPRERLVLRTAAIKEKLDYDKVLKGQLSIPEKERFKRTIKNLSQDKKWGVVASKQFDFKTKSLENLVAKYQPACVYIDGMYLLQSDAQNRIDQAAKTTDDLKKQAIRFEIPYVLSTQFNRDVDSEKEETVTGKGIALTSVLNWHASMMFGLYQSKEMKLARMLEFINLKAREGIGTSIKINWNFNTMNFTQVKEEKKAPVDSYPDDPFAGEPKKIIDDLVTNQDESSYEIKADDLYEGSGSDLPF